MAKIGKVVGRCFILLPVFLIGIAPVFGYVLNTSTMVVHRNDGCRAVQRIAPENYAVSDIIPIGYTPCGICNPRGETQGSSLPAAVRPPITPPAIPIGIPAQNQPARSFPRAESVPRPASPSVTTPEKPVLEWGWVQVKRVIDGDTFELENGTRVRLIGADTPETVHPTRPAEPFGKLASDFTKRCVERSDNWVFLEQDGDTVDKYDRQLAMVYFRLPTNDGEHKFHFLNEGLIRAGLATAQTQYRYSKEMKDRFTKAENEAREKKARIWSTAL